ncbi:hypothetical protein AMS68_006002 [Peltaster fructicola]|uniref:RING-type domain-containing protein n=1 Tax=Peltaster fructicola TaxID=286661 RepID=A0A6H0Y0Q5_9PEZI|nr:hypothetical protein AMS68_006002 [Peltaster fructicola]
MDAIPLLSKPGRLWRDKADFFKPFRKAAKDSLVGENIRPLFDPDLAHEIAEHDADLVDLNNALQTLVEVFPDVEPEVFREMLTNVSQESRVAVVTEHVLKRNITGVARITRRTLGRDAEEPRKSTYTQGLSVEDTFRGHRYHDAVQLLLYQEFKSLSHSAVKGVMAENNDSYTRSRPVLQILASKTWRSSLASLWTRKSTLEDTSTHPALFWQPGERHVPSIRSTGSTQLDRELYNMLISPLAEKKRQQQVASDHILASDLNEAEAIEAEATYDCECCFSTVTFEQIAICDTGEHMLCFDCIRRTTTEALYGQGWARSADFEKSTIRCFAPAMQECQASLASHFVERALHNADGTELWQTLRRRITNEVLLKSRLAFQRCPFCSYAEVDEMPFARYKRPAQIQHHFTRRLTPIVGYGPALIGGSIIACMVVVVLACFMLLVVTISSILGLGLLLRPSTSPPLSLGPVSLVGPLSAAIHPSLYRVHKSRQGLKFKCEDRDCGRTSCTKCLAEWRDQHVCFDNEKTSLRTTIEASATAAVKRTCPRCLLSFVKASGCNKLVCNCGYTMCYVCRSEITTREGYAHFCQHFRPSGGRCSECERCDLYGDEDEEAAIRRAAELAEQDWREQEAAKSTSRSVGAENLTARAMVDAVIGHGKRAPWYERWLDAVFEIVIAFQDD